ncbi:hypothetical protein CYMTET_55546 [Cymbomonas tetramitiformis]|uniref:Uncharacterized protein n=1 Tax=Cymbomonas tetramitiformis TaxID=36881 RepID=A0AAE0EMW1_9CHLO|nr:hypothetical protein CYMTET_55546 [Cymbomonas tetramitiformis]
MWRFGLLRNEPPPSPSALPFTVVQDAPDLLDRGGPSPKTTPRDGAKVAPDCYSPQSDYSPDASTAGSPFMLGTFRDAKVMPLDHSPAKIPSSPGPSHAV